MGMKEGYEVNIIWDRENKLVERKELEIEISHFGKGTPTRLELRKILSSLLNVPEDLIFVRNIRSEYGLNKSRARIHIYENKERALELEPKHIVRKHSKERGE